MHPTADTLDVILSRGLGRRVIGSVRPALIAETKAESFGAECREGKRLRVESGA
jgi:hypothetical protein